MNDCSAAKQKFVTALAQWMLAPRLDGENFAPDLNDFQLCRSCALELFGRVLELGSYYVQDIEAIVHETQVELQSQGRPDDDKPVFKH